MFLCGLAQCVLFENLPCHVLPETGGGTTATLERLSRQQSSSYIALFVSHLETRIALCTGKIGMMYLRI